MASAGKGGSAVFHSFRQTLLDKLQEALRSVLPAMGIVLLLCFTIAPISSSILLCFLLGAALLIAGMMLFTLGVEASMTPMGERVGTAITRRQSLPLLVVLGFILGFLITASEPDLQVLANQVPAIPNAALILSVAFGVGILLVIALLRMLLGVPLPHLLTAFYLVVFGLAALAPADFLAVAFDAGGVTTGPMTVPFIMALGVGISSIRNDRHAADDSFGLVALCSVGPILSVLILSLVYHPADAAYVPPVLPEIHNSAELFGLFLTALPTYLKEIAVSLLPVVLFFGLFQLTLLKLPGRSLKKIGIGLVYTYIGLVIFLTGANVGFMPAGNYLGQIMASLDARWIIVPVGMVIGFFLVKAEPAVYVLNRQVEEVTDGAISAQAMGTSLSIGVALSVGLSFFVPKIFTAIAFDSGGVASGPMTAAFLLPFAQGVCVAVGSNIVTDAFGVVAMVAMTPLITIQVLGLVSELQNRCGRSGEAIPEDRFRQLDDDAIIDL